MFSLNGTRDSFTQSVSAAAISGAVSSTIPCWFIPFTQVDTIMCFTDSRVSLYWIKGIEKEWKPFVQNRANEIRRLVPAQTWEHCPRKDNPADLPFCGVAPTDLVRSTQWHHRPSWLINVITRYNDDDMSMPEECKKEMRSST